MDTENRRLFKVGGMVHQGSMYQFRRIEHNNGTRSKMKNGNIARLPAHAQHKIKTIEAKVQQVTDER